MKENFSVIKYWLRQQSTVDWIIKIWSRHRGWNLLINTEKQREIAISLVDFLEENLYVLQKK